MKHFASSLISTAAALATSLAVGAASADTVNAVWSSATDVPVTASGYTASGKTVSFTLNFVPETGASLTVVNNTSLPIIVGTFDNLAQGQTVLLTYGGITYPFVANYYGGTGNDLVLLWASNRLLGWGLNQGGALGDNTLTNRTSPVLAAATGALAGKTVVSLGAGYSHTLALCSDNTLAAWGGDAGGELGDNRASGTLSLIPVAVNTVAGVSALYGKTLVAIALGSTEQAAGDFNLALSSDGAVAAWGDNAYGQLGDNSGGHPGARRYVPVAVNSDSGVSALYGKKVVAVSAGMGHSLALCSDGTVVAWGRNSTGQLGVNGLTNRLTPIAVNRSAGVSALYGRTVVAIAAGGYHSLGLCSDGGIVAWGNNHFGELGDNSTTNRLAPVAVNTNSGVSALYGKTVVSIAAGQYHSLALCSDGTVAAWGHDGQGELGDNWASGGLQSLVPVGVNTNAGLSALQGKRVVAIVAGAFHNLAICSDGTIAAWGLNSLGEVGDNTTTNRLLPVAVNATSLSASQRFVCVASGPSAAHSLALVAAPPACQVALTESWIRPDGSFVLSFTNNPGAFLGALAASDPSLPLSNWACLGDATEVSPGKFQFTDAQATNSPQRYYRIRSP